MASRSIRPINIAVAGEGPIGLIAIANLIMLNHRDTNAKPITIDWFISRIKYVRRHIIEINKITIEKIEALLEDCNKCILNSDSSKLVSSIRYLEQVIFDKIPSTNCSNSKCRLTIKPNLKFLIDDDAVINNYDHVFLATGYTSFDMRKKLINDDEEFDEITYNINSLIFVFYGNLQLADIPATQFINDLSSFKIKLEDDYIERFIDKNELSALIATVYRFQKINPSIKIDRWIKGFKNYDELISVFEETFKDIKIYGYSKYKKLIATNSVYLNDIQDRILKDITIGSGSYCNNLFEKYKSLLEDMFEHRFKRSYPTLRNNAFMIHSVVPSATSLGCSLYRDNNIKYCNKYKTKTNVWLIGDAANVYPPNESLERNAIHLMQILPTLYTNYFTNNYEVKPILIDIRYMIENLKPRDDIFLLDSDTDGYFKRGYKKEDAANANKITLAELINKIFPKSSRDLTTFIDATDNYKTFYNIATFFSYIINLADIRSNNSTRRSDIKLFTTFGGGIEHLDILKNFELSLKVPK